MRAIVEYRHREPLPQLVLYIHDAPHRRVHLKVIQDYRDALFIAGMAAGLIVPIDYPIDLKVTFINPTSPDLDNLIIACFQAMDGHTLRGPALLADDGLIQSVQMSKMFPNPVKRRQEPAIRLPRFNTIEA